MLSAKKLTSSSAAVSYYERDDYYTGGERNPDEQGVWFGEGAEAIGLQGPVERNAFKAILEGELPNGEVLGRQVDGERQHVAGWDFTFSAPKSVSVLAEIGGDKRLIEAQGVAVREALGWLERGAASYRQMQNGEVRRVDSGNLVVATFQHDTSREQDPQLHTHAVIANASQRADGTWASLDSKPLFEAKMAGGAVYRAALAREVQRLGYEIQADPEKGFFEIAGIPQRVLEAFSERRAQIEAAMQSRGLEGGEDAARAALLTRRSKQTTDRQDLERAWDQRMRATQFDPRPLVEQARQAGDRFEIDLAAPHKAVERAREALSEREAAFTANDLSRAALSAGMGKAGIADIEAAVAHQQRLGELLPASLDGRDAWTTPKARDRERRIVEAVERGRDAMPPIVSWSHIQSVHGSRGFGAPNLNTGQHAALGTILSTKDRFVGVIGLPGSGKTTMLREANAMLALSKHKAVGMAHTADAANKLQAESGIPSGTLTSHLMKADQDLGAMQRAVPIMRDAILDKYRNQVWVVDEASQVSASSMRRLVHAAERLNVRVALIGDTKQLGAIEAGRPFELMLKAGMRHAEMDQIVRQKDAHFRDSIHAVRRGDIGGALNRLDQHTFNVSDEQDRMEAMLAWWRLLPGRESTLILTATNQQKRQLNEGARSVLKSEGRLSGEQVIGQLIRRDLTREQRRSADAYRAGDTLYFGRSLKRFGIHRGEAWQVATVDSANNVLTLITERNGAQETLQWNPSPHGSGSAKVAAHSPAEAAIASGERIRWTRNDRALGLTNGEALRVLAVSGNRLELEKASGQRAVVDTASPQGRHWDHAYASTVYSSQGASVPHVLVNADSSAGELLNQKAFQVAISRHKDTLTIFTDDRQRLEANVARHLGDKTSALESIDERRLSREFADGPTVSWSADQLAGQRQREQQAAELERQPSRGPELSI